MCVEHPEMPSSFRDGRAPTSGRAREMSEKMAIGFHALGYDRYGFHLSCRIPPRLARGGRALPKGGDLAATSLFSS